MLVVVLVLLVSAWDEGGEGGEQVFDLHFFSFSVHS
jgi:hypothetical protein